MRGGWEVGRLARGGPESWVYAGEGQSVWAKDAWGERDVGSVLPFFNWEGVGRI